MSTICVYVMLEELNRRFDAGLRCRKFSILPRGYWGIMVVAKYHYWILSPTVGNRLNILQ